MGSYFMLQFVTDKCIMCVTKSHHPKLGLGNWGLWLLTCTQDFGILVIKRKKLSLNLKQSAALSLWQLQLTEYCVSDAA